MRKFSIVVVLGFLAIFAAGCYWNADVEANEVGVRMSRNAIQNCVTPGVYTDMGFFSELKAINRGTVTFSVEDPEVASKDTQTMGVRITIQARRLEDCDSITNLLTNWPTLINDQTMIDTISATAREGMKNGVRSMTAMQLLDDRNGLADAIRSQLTLDVQKYNVEIINVTVENIAPSVEWIKTYQDKANLQAETEKELQRQNLIKQQGANAQLEQEQQTLVYNKQLDTEKAKTLVDVEIASREGKKTAAAQEVYSQNPEAYDLKRLELLAKIFGDKAVIWMLDKTVNLNTLFSKDGTPQTVIPVIQPSPTPTVPVP